jgi:hypothetical protein
MLTIDMADCADIVKRRSCFTGQVKNLSRNFSAFDPLTLDRPFRLRLYGSYFGCKLRYLLCFNLNEYFSARENRTMQVWHLPRTGLRSLINSIDNCVLIYESILQRFCFRLLSPF